MQREKKIREGRLFLSLTKDFLSQASPCIDDLTKIPVHVEQKSGKAQHGLGKVSVPSSPPCLWDAFSSGPQHCNPRENKIIITLYNNNNTSSLCWGCYPRHGGFGAPLCPISAGTSDVRGP